MPSDAARRAGSGLGIAGGGIGLRRSTPKRIVLSSDDPLGLGDHPRVRRAAGEAAERFGTAASAVEEPPGSPAPRLRQALVELLGGERAVLFGSAREAARAAVVASAARGGLVAADERSSCGFADGARAAGAEFLGYRHRDVGQLATALRSVGRRRIVIATDSVFGESGSAAPLRALAAVASRTGAELVIDESHAIGVRAEAGRGLAADAGIAAGPGVVLTGSLGRALGSQGGFACAAGAIVAALAAPGPSSADGPAPPACGAALAALRLLVDSPGLISALERNAIALREALADQGFDIERCGGHIVSIRAGDPRRAVALAERAAVNGVAIEAVGLPAAPASRARIRLRAAAAHRVDELCSAARILGQAAREVGIIGPVAGRLGQQASNRAA